MALELRKATRKRIKLRMSIQGAYKSGKSLTSMVIMDSLLKRLKEAGELEGNGQFAVGDSERRSSERYARSRDGSGYDFDVVPIAKGSADEFIECLNLIESHHYSGAMLDSISPEWAGKHGIVAQQGEMVEAKSSKGRVNGFAVWGEAKKPHHAFLDRVTSADMHLICTIRCSIKHSQDPSGAVVRLGWKPKQHEEVPFEFDILAEMNHRHQLKIIGSRFRAIDNLVFDPIGTVGATNPIESLGTLIADWLTDGGAATETDASHAPTLDAGLVRQIVDLKTAWGIPEDKWMHVLTNTYGVSRIEDIDPDKATTLVANLKERVRKKTVDAGTASILDTALVPPSIRDAPRIEPEPTPAPAVTPPASTGLSSDERVVILGQIQGARLGMGMPEAAFRKGLAKFNVEDASELQDEELTDFRDRLLALWEKKRAASSTPIIPVDGNGAGTMEPPAASPSTLSPAHIAGLVDGSIPTVESNGAGIEPAPEPEAVPATTAPPAAPKRTRTRVTKPAT